MDATGTDHRFEEEGGHVLRADPVDLDPEGAGVGVVDDRDILDQ